MGWRIEPILRIEQPAELAGGCLIGKAPAYAAATSVRQAGSKAPIAEPVNPATGEPATAPKAAPAK